jgi:hypothetical protein
MFFLWGKGTPSDGYKRRDCVSIVYSRSLRNFAERFHASVWYSAAKHIAGRICVGY